VAIKTVVNLFSIGKTILSEAASDRSQTLVVGKHSTPGSLFTGSVSRYLINNARNCALWVVP